MERERNFSQWQDGGPWKDRDWSSWCGNLDTGQLHELHVKLRGLLGLLSGEVFIDQYVIEEMQRSFSHRRGRAGVSLEEAVFLVLARRASLNNWISKELDSRVEKN